MSPDGMPCEHDDELRGFEIGNIWVDLDTSEMWVCTSAKRDNATWVQMKSGPYVRAKGT